MIHKLLPGKTEPVNIKLVPGQVFGELALINDAPRTADVVVMSDEAKVVSLDRTSFHALLQGKLEVVMTRTGRRYSLHGDALDLKKLKNRFG